MRALIRQMFVSASIGFVMLSACRPAMGMDANSWERIQQIRNLIVQNSEYFVHPKYSAQLERVLNLAIHELIDREARGQIRIADGLISKDLKQGKHVFPFSMEVERYIRDVANGFTGEEFNPIATKLPRLIAANLNRHNTSLDKVVQALHRRLDRYDASKLGGRWLITNSIIDFVINNLDYRLDTSSPSRLSYSQTLSRRTGIGADSVRAVQLRATYNQNYTPYTKPFSDPGVDYIKSPAQALVDNGDDCDGFVLTTMNLNARYGFNSFFVMADYIDPSDPPDSPRYYHALQGFELSEPQYLALFDQDAADFETLGGAELSHAKLLHFYAQLLYSSLQPSFGRFSAPVNLENTRVPYTTVLAVSDRQGKRKYLLLVEPQSKRPYLKSFDPFPRNEEFSCGRHMEISQVIDSSGKDYPHIRGKCFSGRDFRRITVTRKGRVTFVPKLHLRPSRIYRINQTPFPSG